RRCRRNVVKVFLYEVSTGHESQVLTTCHSTTRNLAKHSAHQARSPFWTTNLFVSPCCTINLLRTVAQKRTPAVKTTQEWILGNLATIDSQVLQVLTNLARH